MLKVYLDTIRENVLFVVVFALFSSFVTALVSYFFIDPVYEANSSVVIHMKSVSNYEDIKVSRQLMKSYGELAKTRSVAQHVLDELDLGISVDELQSQVHISQKADTQFIILSSRSKDAEQAMEISHQFAKSFKEVSREVFEEDSVKLMDMAELPTKPYRPTPLLNTVLAFILGAAASAVFIFLKEYYDNKIRGVYTEQKPFQVQLASAIPIIDKEE